MTSAVTLAAWFGSFVASAVGRIIHFGAIAFVPALLA